MPGHEASEVRGLLVIRHACAQVVFIDVQGVFAQFGVSTAEQRFPSLSVECAVGSRKNTPLGSGPEQQLRCCQSWSTFSSPASAYHCAHVTVRAFAVPDEPHGSQTCDCSYTWMSDQQPAHFTGLVPGHLFQQFLGISRGKSASNIRRSVGPFLENVGGLFPDPISRQSCDRQPSSSSASTAASGFLRGKDDALRSRGRSSSIISARSQEQVFQFFVRDAPFHAAQRGSVSDQIHDTPSECPLRQRFCSLANDTRSHYPPCNRRRTAPGRPTSLASAATPRCRVFLFRAGLHRSLARLLRPCVSMICGRASLCVPPPLSFGV